MNKKTKSTLEKLKKELRFKGYSENTIKIYSHYVEMFLWSFDCDGYHISQKQAINWIKSQNYTSISKQNQVISSIKLYYKYIVGVKLKSFVIERPRWKRKLPIIINHEYLISKILKIGNVKHKAILSLAYSTGMKVSEIINLKITDIDSVNMLILIRNSKFNKDRYVKLTPYILHLLRMYYREYKPYIYLFNGQNKLHYTSGSCNKIVKKYLGEIYHMHLLRHSYATKSMENETDKRLLQNQMGHSSSKTLDLYTHVSNDFIQKSNTPL